MSGIVDKIACQSSFLDPYLFKFYFSETYPDKDKIKKGIAEYLNTLTLKQLFFLENRR